MRTLLTGFGPFGATIDNPSARIVAHFAQSGALGHDLTTRVLPVSHDRAAEEVSALLREGAFDAALLMGVATRTAVLRLERVTRHRGGGHRPDVDGRSPTDTTLLPGALPTYTATVALEPLAAVLAAADVPARLSDDAGGYVCNHTYYAALQTLAATALPTRCLFLHVPPDAATFATLPDGPALPLERQIMAVGHVLAALLRERSR